MWQHTFASVALLPTWPDSPDESVCYLAQDWEKKTVQDQMDMFMKYGLPKPRKDATFYRKYEEKREAEILQKLENVLADIVGGESTNV